jgi:hypothetical protein
MKPPVYSGPSFSPTDCVYDLDPDLGIDVRSASTGLDTSLALHQYSVDGGINWLPINSEAEILGCDAIFTVSAIDSEATNGLARFAAFNAGRGKLCTGPGATGLTTGKEYVTCFRMKISSTTCQNELAVIQIKTATVVLKQFIITASDFACIVTYNEIPVRWTYDGSGAVDTEITFNPGITDLWVDSIKTFLIGSVTGTVGTTAKQRQTALGVPFNMVSSTDNKARFAIFDTSKFLGLSDAYNVCILSATSTPATRTPTPSPTHSGPRVPVNRNIVLSLLLGILSILSILFWARKSTGKI